MRKLTRQIQIGNVKIGGGAPCSVQSMCSTDTRDTRSTLDQITRLTAAGCEIVRCAVPDMDAAEALATIKSQSSIPLIADIHFDYRLALKALEAGVPKATHLYSPVLIPDTTIVVSGVSGVGWSPP